MEDVEAALTEWQARAEDDDAITASLFRTLLHGNMGGQLFVREVEVPEAGGEVRQLALPGVSAPFFRLSFREALEAFLARRVVSPEVWESMNDLARQGAFSGARLASEAAAQRVFSLLESTLRQGGTLRDFQAAVSPSDLGITADSPGYLENVYRTSTQMAYGQGRLTQLEHPAVLSARPHVQYRTAGDSRVRPSHAALQGVIFDRDADPGWRRYAPPLGYQCRCALVTLRPDRVDSSAVVLSTDLASNVGSDPNWTGPGA